MKNGRLKNEKSFTLFLTATLILGGAGIVHAQVPFETSETIAIKEIEIISPQFPEAYIEIDSVHYANDQYTRSSPDDRELVVTATAYYGQNFQESADEIAVVEESRLLNQQEVEELNRWMANPYATVQQVYDEYGTLTLVLTFTKRDALNYDAAITALWNPTFSFSGEKVPASGDDFMGILWGGDFDVGTLYGGWYLWTTGSRYDARLVKHEPNAAMVWSFLEYVNNANHVDWAQQAGCYVQLQKNTLTGDGNTTSIVAQYTHTWSDLEFGVSVDKDGLSFSLDNQEKAWDLVVFVSGIEY